MLIFSFLIMFLAVGSQFYRLTKANAALMQAELDEDHRAIKKYKTEKVIFTVTTILFFAVSIFMVIYAVRMIG